MSEKILTPETKTSSGDIPKALQIKEIDKLRTDQSLREDRAVMDAPHDDLVEQESKRMEARASFEDMIVEYLEKRGIDKDHEKFKDYKQFLLDHSVDRISNATWENGDPDDDASLSGRMEASREISEKYSSIASSTETTPVPAPIPVPTSTEEEKIAAAAKTEKRLTNIAELEKDLVGVRAARHAAFGARMAVNTLRFMKKKKLSKEFQEAEALYLESIEKLESLSHEAHVESGGGSEEFNKELEARLNKQFVDDKEAQRQALVEKGGLKAKTLEWWANLSPKKKMAYGVLGGAALAATGFGIGFLATAAGGVVGTVLAGTAGAGLAGTKGVRGWAMVESGIYAKDKGTEKLDVKRKKDMATADYLQDALGAMRRQTEEKMKKADLRKAAAVAIGIGSTLIGSAAAIHAYDMATSAPRHIGGPIGEAIAGPDTPPAPPQELPKWDATLEAEVTKTPEAPTFNPEASQLFKNDGGYDILNRIKDAQGQGIPQEHWAELWNKVGPDLANVKMSNGVPFGYEMPNGEWGVRMPPVNGEGVPKGALEAIANKHQELFGTNPALSGGNVAEVVSEKNPLPPTLDHSPLTQSDVDVLKASIRDGNMSLDATAINAHPEVFGKLSYVGKGLDLHTYATQALGLPDRWAGDVETLVAKQLEANNSAFTSLFERVNGELVFRGGGRIPPEVLARMFNSIPPAIRSEFALAR